MTIPVRLGILNNNDLAGNSNNMPECGTGIGGKWNPPITNPTKPGIETPYVAYWKLDESTGTETIDYSENLLPAEHVGASVGIYNAPYYDGSARTICENTAMYDTTTELSVVFFFKPFDNLGHSAAIVTKGGIEESWAIYLTPQGELKFSINDTHFITTQASYTNVDKTYKVACVFKAGDPATLEIWVDNAIAPLAGGTFSSAITSIVKTTTKVTLASTDEARDHYNGWIRDVYIFRKQLLASDIQNIPDVIIETDVVQPPEPPPTGEVYISIKNNGGGVTSPATGNYTIGSTITLTATPNTGYEFSTFSGDIVGSENPRDITITKALSIVAVFRYVYLPPTEYYLNTNNILGLGSVSPVSGYFDTDSSVVVTATPDSGYEFSNFSGDLSGSTNPQNITMSKNMVVGATFTKENLVTYSLTTVAIGEGTISPSGTTVYDVPTSVVVSATPNSGNSFIEFSGDLTGNISPQTCIVTGEETVTARFTTEEPTTQYLLETRVYGNGGISPATALYDEGSIVDITIVAYSGSSIDYFTIENYDGTRNVYNDNTTVTMTSDTIATVSFSDMILYSINTVITGAGTVTLSPEGPTYLEGITVTITIIPAVGQIVASIMLNGISAPTSGSTIDIIMVEDFLLQVVFEEEAIIIPSYEQALINTGLDIIHFPLETQLGSGAVYDTWYESISINYNATANSLMEFARPPLKEALSSVSGVARSIGFDGTGYSFGSVRTPTITNEIHELYKDSYSFVTWFYKRDWGAEDLIYAGLMGIALDSIIGDYSMYTTAPLGATDRNIYLSLIVPFANAISGFAGNRTRVYIKEAFTTRSDPLLNTWNMASYTIDNVNRQVTLYMNGMVIGSAPFPTGYYIENETLYLSNWAVGTTISGNVIADPMKECDIDEVSFVKGVLSAQDMASLYSSGTGKPIPGIYSLNVQAQDGASYTLSPDKALYNEYEDITISYQSDTDFGLDKAYFENVPGHSIHTHYPSTSGSVTFKLAGNGTVKITARPLPEYDYRDTIHSFGGETLLIPLDSAYEKIYNMNTYTNSDDIQWFKNSSEWYNRLPTTPTIESTGIVNQATKFLETPDDNVGYIELTNSNGSSIAGSFLNGNYTVNVWANMSAIGVSGWRPFVSVSNDNIANTYKNAFNFYYVPYNDSGQYTTDSAIGAVIYYRKLDGTEDKYFLTAPCDNLISDTWQFISIVVSVGTNIISIHIYLNSVLVKTKTLSGNIYYHNNYSGISKADGVLIGTSAYNDYSSAPNNMLDEITITKMAMSAAQISTLYNKGKP